MSKAQPIKQSKDYSANDLLQFGVDHLCASKFLYGSSAVFFDSAAYLSCLGIELLLKAWLLFSEGHHPKVHGLIRLWNRVALLHPVTLEKQNMEWMKELDRHYALRYPPATDVIETGSEDWENTEILFTEIIHKLPDPLQEIIQNLDSHMKGGRILMKKLKEQK